MATITLTTTISTKGQVILPKAVRDQLHWDAGTRLAVEQTADGLLLKPLMSTFAAARVEDVFGCLAYSGVAKSAKEMDAGVVAEARLRHARDRH